MQQINLYIAEFRPNREPLRSLHLLYGALFFILVLGCYSLWSWQQIAAKNEEMIKEQESFCSK